MAEIEVAHALLIRCPEFPPVNSVFIAIDDCPNGLVAQRPPARVQAVEVHRVERFPSLAREKRGHSALECCHAPRSLCIPRGDPVPDTPHIFPADRKSTRLNSS